ncbi:hypothetical protein ACWCPQ_34215 [Nocardia sp. NPDC001965]
MTTTQVVTTTAYAQDGARILNVIAYNRNALGEPSANLAQVAVQTDSGTIARREVDMNTAFALAVPDFTDKKGIDRAYHAWTAAVTHGELTACDRIMQAVRETV